MIEIIKYTTELKKQWDDFVSIAKNGTFLFYRDYMEYHADRFVDYSLMIYSNNKLAALLPANIVDNTVYSHQGLTFGGMVLSKKYHYKNIIDYLNSINNFLSTNSISKFILKIPPYFYTENLAQDQSLALLRNKQTIVKTSLGVCINSHNYNYPKRCVRKNKLDLYKVSFNENLKEYWNLLEFNLQDKYKSKPVHSLDEIKYLISKFPNNIQLLSLINNENKNMEAGAILYLSKHTCKVQYFATSEEGRKNRASDVLYYDIIKNYKDKYQFIDFGTCEEGNDLINTALLETKEKFGANTFPIFTFESKSNSILTE